MKRLISLVLSLTIILTMISVSVVAEDEGYTFSVYVGGKSELDAELGQIITVNMKIDKNGGSKEIALEKLDAAITFDTEYLEYLSASIPSTGWHGPMGEVSVVDGVKQGDTLKIFRAKFADNISLPCNFVTISFRTIKEGTTKITLSNSRLFADNKNYTAAMKDATVNIVDKQYTLKFETDGGSAIDEVVVNKGENVDLSEYKTTKDGYVFDGWYKDAAYENKVTSVVLDDSTTVYAKWNKEKAEVEEPVEPSTPADKPINNPYEDVNENMYFFTPVMWAAENNITTGTSPTSFSPDASCTRAQTVTFLWRAAGSPAPKTTDNPFSDVAKGSYYYDAVLWAIENGITNGVSDKLFAPDETVNRAQTVTFLYRSAGKPEVSTVNPFVDVESGAYYANPVLWAANNGITTGTSAKTFDPDSHCTRGQIVTFLYRHIVK